MKAFKFALNLLFPPRCPFCGEIVEIDKECDVCENELKQSIINPEFRKLEDGEEHRILSKLDAAAAFFLYQYPVDRAIIRFKFRGRPELRTVLSYYMFDAYGSVFADVGFDMIIPVPSYFRAERRRDYIPTKLLAEALSKLTGIEYEHGVLIKHKKTPPQHRLSYAKRGVNLIGAYSVTKPERVAGKRILLIDDVITSGNTMNECAKVLKKYRATYIGGLAVATTPNNSYI